MLVDFTSDANSKACVHYRNLILPESHKERAWIAYLV